MKVGRISANSATSKPSVSVSAATSATWNSRVSGAPQCCFGSRRNGEMHMPIANTVRYPSAMVMGCRAIA
jgi:hypothetical protein